MDSHSTQANSGNINDFIHMPTHEFLEGKLRKQIEQEEDLSRGQGDAAADTQEVAASPPQLIVEVDPQLLQAGERCLELGFLGLVLLLFAILWSCTSKTIYLQ